MLKYIGTNEYEFWTSKNKMIVLSKDDIDEIIEQVIKDSDFSIGSKIEELKENNAHWKELWNDLKDDFEELKEDIRELVK